MHLRAARVDFFGSILHRHVQGSIGAAALRTCPAGRIINHSLNLRMMVDGIQFVAWTKVKNTPTAASPTIAASENFPSFEPRNEYLLVRHGDAERFTVHF